MNQQYDKNHLSIKWACKKKKMVSIKMSYNESNMHHIIKIIVQIRMSF